MEARQCQGTHTRVLSYRFLCVKVISLWQPLLGWRASLKRVGSVDCVDLNYRNDELAVLVLDASIDVQSGAWRENYTSLCQSLSVHKVTCNPRSCASVLTTKSDNECTEPINQAEQPLTDEWWLIPADCDMLFCGHSKHSLAVPRFYSLLGGPIKLHQCSLFRLNKERFRQFDNFRYAK